MKTFFFFFKCYNIDFIVYEKGLFIFLQKGIPHPYVPDNVPFTFLMFKKLLTYNKLIRLNNIFIDFLNDINKIHYQVTLSTFYLLHILLHIQRFYK